MKKAFLWLTLISLVLIMIPGIFGQSFPLEFRTVEIEKNYYLAMLTSLAFSFIIYYYFKKRESNIKIYTFKFLCLNAGVMVVYLCSIFFVITFLGFGLWVDERIIYIKKSNPEISIKEQIFDIGTFGYGKRRIVKITPLSPFLQIASDIDTVKITKAEWNRLN